MAGLDQALSGMAAQFTRDGDGYLYRANGKGPPIRVSREERDRYVRRFPLIFIGHTALFMALVIAGAVLTGHFYPAGDEAGGFVLMGGALLAAVLLTYLSLRWWMLAPARAFADRVAR